jgi:tetratricopeptide (TPR) repeat protein
MKKSILILFIFMGITCSISQELISNAEWIKKTSCTKNADLIANQAMESMLNLEYLIAYGQAKSALLLDADCGCALLTLARVSSGNEEWGSRQSKLSKINRDSLSSEEKAWYDIMSASDDVYEKDIEKAKQSFPESPFFNYMIDYSDFPAYKKFTEDFPDHASSAYNMVSYGYVYGDYGDVNYEKAKDAAYKSTKLHNGPNIYDSMAEHEFNQGNYEEALKYQRQAIDFGTFSSPYWVRARMYYSLVNKEEVVATLVENQKAIQEAFFKNDFEAYSKFVDSNSPLVAGDSNLQPFYTVDKSSFDGHLEEVTWNLFELYDFETHFSPSMTTAVLTFYAKGTYVVEGSDSEVAYRTRASSVWVDTDDGWKIIHENFAPQKDSSGIPSR